MSTASRVRVHLELPARSWRTGGVFDVGDLQLLRAAQRPLLSPAPFAGYGVAQLSRTHAYPGPLLTLREGACWHDGAPVTIAELAAGVLEASRRQGALAQLMGIRGMEQVSERSLCLHMDHDNHLLPRYLASASCSPRREGTGPAALCGAFRPLDAGGFVPAGAEARSLALEVCVSSDAREVRELFDAGELDLTCPAAFDVADAAREHPRFRPVMPDLHAFLLVHPARVPQLARPRSRAALAAHVATPALARELLVPLQAPMGEGQGARLHGARASVLFADHYPNRAIVESVAAGLGQLGAAAIELEATSLARLVERLAVGDFELALVLSYGSFGLAHSLPLSLAAMVLSACDAHVRAHVLALAAASLGRPDDVDARSRLYAAVLRAVPAVPLFRFRSGYLASRAVPDLPLLDGCIYPLEQLLRPSSTSS